MFKAIFFDLSGVLYEGDTVITGAVAAIEKAQKSKLIVRFITNTARKTTATILADLTAKGFSVTADQLYSAPKATMAYLQARKLRPYLLIHKNLISDFCSFKHTSANAVVIADAEHDFTYQNLNKAFQLCQQGAELIGIGDNKYFKQDGALHLDAGPFIHAIAYAANVTPTIIGKPSTAFYQQVIDSCGVNANEILMVGDDVTGDAQGALNANMHACLVKTGKYQRGDENKITAENFICLNSIVEAVNYALNVARAC